MSKIATISTTVSTTTGLWAWIGNKRTVREEIERDLVNKIKLAASRGALISDIIDDGDKIKSFERRRFRHIDRKTG